MDKEIDPEVLISLVEERTNLWDKTSHLYNDRVQRVTAWREIFCILIPDYDELEDREKEYYGKYFFLLHFYKFVDIAWSCTL